ncbi:MAG: rhodanese-like domain-containing protein [Caldilineaceae bacterium]|nr:rhodanese-like domain-containing protein [Caldilineaceae bacterium]
MNILTRFFGGAQATGHTLLSPADYQARFVDGKQAHTLVDVRTSGEFGGGHIPGALNISLQDLSGRLDKIPTDKPVVVYCRTGNRSSFAARTLLQSGFDEVFDLGGIIDWQRQGQRVEK